jgi:hypothetical protein
METTWTFYNLRHTLTGETVIPPTAGYLSHSTITARIPQADDVTTITAFFLRA